MSRINAALYIVMDWQWRRVAGRRRSLRGADNYCVPGKFAKGARFSPVLRAPLLYDPKRIIG